MEDDTGPGDLADSLLPYDQWTEEALRHVVVRALQWAAAEGLPGGHHYYITFRTDLPGVDIPGWLRAKYSQEMTIILQNRFWDLQVDPAAGRFSVGLSFGGVAANLQVPIAAVTAFADPHVRFGLRFAVAEETLPDLPDEGPADSEAGPESDADADADQPEGEAQVVSLDAFRRRSPPTT